jgi:peptidyl-prolyl cis-trans isomerase SurA
MINGTTTRKMHLRGGLAYLCLLAVLAAAGSAQSNSQAAPNGTVTPIIPVAPKQPSGTELDRVVVIVNGDLILDSDVDQELRFEKLKIYGVGTSVSANTSAEQVRNKATERLINRELILQQIRSQPELDPSEDDVTKGIDDIRKTIPACSQFHCETKAGWDSYLASGGFTEDSFREQWRERMKVLAFTEQRFRMGIRISPDRVKEYYEKTMLPQYAAMHATAPPLAKISDRIQAVLLEQEVSSLLNTWLQSLRAQGNVVVLHPDGDTP